MNQPNDSTELLLTVGPGSTPTLGFEVHGTSGSFDPAAVQILDANTNAVIPLNLAENNHGGTTDSLTLATLAPGEYSIFVSGQTAATGNFTIDIFMPGDSDGSGSVSDTEYQYALAASYQNLFGFNHYTSQLIQSMGLDPTKNYYSEEQDSDKDGDIDNHDLEMMNSNRNVPPLQLELIGDQDAPAVVAGLLIDSGVSNSDGITNDLTIVGNVTDESLITQFKVALDGGSFVDIFGQLSGGASGGTFTLTRSWLETNLNGGSSLEGGVHTLHFMTADEHGNVSAPGDFDVSFELDVTDPTVASPIGNQTLNEDFVSFNLGPFTDFFNQNGGTPLSYNVYSITSAIVDFDFATDELILTSKQDANGSADIVIQAIDAAGNAVLSNTFTVTVNAINDAPVAVDDNLATPEDFELDYLAPGILTNDTDVENDPLTVTEVNGSAGDVGNEITIGAGGKLTINSTGAMSFDPDGAYEYLAVGETTTETFTYTVSDGNGGTDTATVTITIIGVNDDPTAADTGIAATEDGGTVTTGVLTGDVDSDDDATTLTYVITAQPSEGSATSNDDGTFTFDPGSDFQDLAVGETRQVTFTYTATDSHSAVSNTGTVTVTVTGVNDDPTAADVGIAAVEDGATVDGSFDGDDVDSDDTPASLTYAITSTPSEGGVVNNNDGSFTFDPGSDFQDLAAGETRQVTFTYTATDSHSAVSNTGTVTVTVTGVNDDPTAADTGIAATEDGSTVTTGVLTGDVDSDDDATTLTYAITAQPSEGSASSNDDGTFTFDPGSDFQDLAAGETRQVTFTYTATDSHSAVSNTGTVTVTVTGVNDDPTAADTGIAATEDGSTVTTGVLTGDVDSDDDATTLTYAITAQPSEGSASSNDDGSFTFDPGSDFQDLAAGETRQVTFTYTATDSHSAVSNTGTVTVTVTGVNDDPTAADTGIAATEDGGTVTTGVLTGDVDSDDDATTLTYAITAQPSEGSATSNDDGTFTFDPGSDFQDLAVGETRQVTFTYTATDSHSAVSNTGTVTVTVTGVNDDPTVADVGIAAVEDGATVDGSFDGADVDSDDTPASLTYAITSTPSEGGVVNNNDGSFTFDPGSDFQDLAAGETRQVTFTYTATDSHSAVSNTGTVTVTVTGVNDDPTAADTGIAATEDGGTVTTGVLTGDVDSDDDATTLTYAITAQPSEGSATSNDDGTFTFDPGSDFQDLAVGETRQVTFTYTATDSHSAVSNTGTVTVTVTGVNDDPTVADVGIAAVEDGATVDGSFDGDDVDSDDTPASLTYAITSTPSEGGVVNNNDGSFTFDPGSDFQDLAAGETRQVTFTYTATDSHSAVSNTGTVTVTVTGVNDDPTAADTGIAATEDGSTVTTGVLTGDVDSDDDATTLTYAITAQPSEGSAISNDDGSFTFDPGSDFQDLAAGETRQVTFTYTATDSHSAVSNTGTVTVTVTGVNDDPTAADTGIAATEDGSTVTTGVLTGDVDSDDDANTLTYAITAQPSEGSATSNDDGTFTFDPGSDFQDLAAGETRLVTFTYTATDSHSAVSNTGTVTVTVTGVNDAPTAADTGIAATEDGSTVTTGVLTGDVDSDDDATTLTYAITAQPSEGSATSNDDGTFTFDPGSDFQDLAVGETRQVTFTYTATDSHSAVSNTGTVTVTVTGVNDDPTVADVGIAAVEDGATVDGSFDGDDVDSDDTPVSLTYAITSTPSEGGVVNNNDGSFTFDPGSDFQDLAAGETRQVTFTYTATDSHSAVSNTGTVTVTVTGVNDDPTAADTGIAATEDGSTVTTGVLTGDVDSDDDATTLTYAITAQPSEGSATSNDDGTFTFDPGSDFQDLAVGETRQVTFTYTATDSHSAVSNTGTVTVTVTGVNDDPTAADTGIAATEDGSTVTTGVLTGDVDSDDDATTLTYAITAQPSEGSASSNDDGTFTFDPGSDFQDLAVGETRQVTFTYTATDSHSAVSNTGTVTVTVTGVNDPPVANDDAIDVNKEIVFNGSVLVNNGSGIDSDPDTSDNPLLFISQLNSNALVDGATVTLASGAELTMHADGNFTYDPTTLNQSILDSLVGTVTFIDSFTYQLNDTHSGVDVATVTVTVSANQLPIANPDSAATDEETPILNIDVLGNDTDPDQITDPPTVANLPSMTSTGGASLTLNLDGTIDYDPTGAFDDLAAGATTTDTFTYTLEDERGGQSLGTVTVTLTGVNDAPTAGDEGIAATEDGSTVTTGVLTGDVDSDDDATTLTYAITAQPSEGSATSNDDGTFTFDPGSDFQDLAVGETRQVTFTYTATDSHSAVSNTGTVTVTVTGVNDDPTVADVGIAADEDGATVDGSFDGDDVDSDDTPASLTYAITSTPSEGGVVNNNDGSFTFDPGSDFQDLAAGETRQVTFTYTATDSHSAVSNTGTVTVTVTGVNDDPTAADTGIAATEDGGTVTTGVLTGDVDSDDDATTLTYAITAQPSEGSATSNDDGTFTFDPGSDFQDLAAGETRQVTFTYTATDSHSAVSNTGTVTVTVTGVNDAPTAADTGIAATEDGSTVTTGVLTGDVDSDDDATTLTYAITAQPSEGSATSNDDGSFTFDPGSDFQDLAAGETRQVTFTYTATDSHSAVSNTGTVTVTVTGVNDPVTAKDDDITTSKDNTVNFDARLDNGNGPDLDPDTSDMLSVFEITDTTLGTVAATVGGAITLDSGATLTLQTDGTLTYDPNGQFSGLVLPTDTATDTFTYSISDGNGSSDTATVTVTVTGSNELLELTTPLPDISSDGLSPETIDLDTHFNDPDAGDTVTYSIVSAELVGGGSFPAKFWVDNVGISGSDLNITFTDYKSDQVRLPIEIKVKAHSSDTLSPDVEDTFILSPDPQQTIDIQLLARNTVSADRDFTSFRAEGGVTSQGGARFQLVNSQQDMTYLVDLSDFFLDLDGTGTGDPNDNLSKLEIIDTANGNNVLFKIFDSATADDNPTLDTASSLLTGTWAAGEGFTSGILDKFYNGDLAVRYSSSGGVTGIVSGGNIMVSPEVDGIGSLPSQINQVIEGSSYVVEIWVSDQLAQVLASQTTETRDLVAVWLDLVWNDTSAVHADFSSATGDASAFGTTDDGVIMNGAGKVDDIKGLTRIPGFGENGYARIGYVSFIADTPTPDADPIDFSVNFTPGDDSITRGTEVDFSQISINGTSVNQIGTSEFLIQTDMSNVSVNGTININGEVVNLSAQDVGLDNTSVSGRLEVLFDDVNNPSTIQIVDSFIDVNPAGLALPDRVADNDNLTAEELADFGLSGVLSNFNGTGNPANISMAIRDALVQVLSSEQTLDGSGNFDISENWNLTNGDLYSMTVVPAFGNLVVDDSVESTAGEIMTFIDPVTGFPSGLPDWSHANLSEISAGLYELLIPISRQISFTTSGGYDVVLNLTGYATARFLVDQETTDQYGDTIATAQATGLSSTSTGTNTYYGGIGNNTSIADPLSDVDMFQVQLNAGDSVIVDVDADQFDTGLDSVVRIFDAAGNEVAYSDDDLAPDEFTIDFASNYDSYVTFTASTSGNYYIGVSAYNFTDDPASYDPTTTTGRPTGVDPSDVGSYDLHITVQNGAAPLHGTQAAVSDAPLEDGTSVDMVVVRNQTQLDSTGQTSSLPTSDTWIDEWSSFWVEIYVETADAKGITDAIANLNYNTNFFTATAIEFGNSFADNGTAIIDDANGVVTGLSGTAQYDKAGNLKKALLARVKFESLEQDDVSIDFEDKFIGPHALGLSLSNVSVNLTDNAETTLIVGDAPETDLWAIAYDVNDDDSIDFRDLVILASIYNQNVLDADSPYVWALDADKSGTVNFKDLTFFASNYGVHKGGNKEVVYPPNFLQRWYGQTTNISGDSSINDVMDTALGIWQDALGMDEPLDIQLVITDLGGTQLGEGQISAVDEQGRPVAGIVTLDDDAAGLGWYSDVSTTAFGGGDLEGGVSYTADMNSDAAGHYDLLTVLLHEIGHVLGFTDTYAPFESHVQAGVGGTLSFVGNGFEATLTDDGLHLDDTVHAGDVMNATLDPGVRKLPSILDALILQTAHETAATGNFDILVGATAPLTASDVPLTGNGDSVLPEALQPLTTLAVPYTDVVSVPVSSESASSQDEGSGSSLPVVWRQVLNTLSQNLSSGSDQSDLDLTLLDGLNEEFVQTLRENGLSIVESGEIHSFDFSDLDPADWQLTGLDQDGDGGFDEVFSDWAGPIL
ncbi:tandem-95 repeat protein [Gimesia panareensis]|uniref:tandem-95 repeat protein n=1 Tax=Gimesia panareensis TaxID=2527978 RepID=UPI0018D5F04A|nr:Ig-like domain-containing protein [Gimesia panareensis]